MKFENVEIDEFGNLKNKLCPFTESNSRNCGKWCPHFGTPEELIVTRRHHNHIAEKPTYTDERTGLYSLTICHGTKIKLGKVVM